MKGMTASWIRLGALMGGVSIGGVCALAQCPSSPGYSPDFSSNQSCLAFNQTNSSGFVGSPSFTGPISPETDVTTALQLTANQDGWATSAWYKTTQPVVNGFSTTFSFELGDHGVDATTNADGIAFVVQSDGTTALGPGGCSIGYGNCGSVMGGIPSSLAIEFNTYNNGAGIDTVPGAPGAPPTTSSDDVTIQSCGSAANASDSSCQLKAFDLTGKINLSDGNPHVATITYSTTCTNGAQPPCSTVDVVVDGLDLFPGGVPFNITTILMTNNSDAYVGFTAGTGAANEFQQILNWTFTPSGGSQTGNAPPGQTTTFNFNGGFQEGSPTTGFDYTVNQSSNQQVQMVVSAIPTSQAACTALVQKSFSPAQCFVYKNGGGQGVDSSVMFEVTCPPAGSCGSAINPFQALLGTDYGFFCANSTPSENSPVDCGLASITSPSAPLVGFLKGDGPDPIHPCTPYPSGTIPLFASNQITSFNVTDVSGSAHAGSGGTTSCWVMTYLTPGEAPTAAITQPVNGHVYTLGESDATTKASFACSTVDALSTSPTGPYLTQASCTAQDDLGSAITTGEQFDTSIPGTHTLTATVVDSAGNAVSQTVTYEVVTGAAPASGLKCNGVYNGTFKGTITVTKGQSCIFIGGGVNGNVAELGGNFGLSNATITGNLSTIGGTLSIGPMATIRGNVALLDILGGAGQDQICGATLGGNVEVLDDQVPILIGSSTGCAGNMIAGSLLVTDNAATTAIYGNTVGGSLVVLADPKATQVFNNTVKSVLNCQGNSAITGGGNTAASKQNQCKTF